MLNIHLPHCELLQLSFCICTCQFRRLARKTSCKPVPNSFDWARSSKSWSRLRQVNSECFPWLKRWLQVKYYFKKLLKRVNFDLLWNSQILKRLVGSRECLKLMNHFGFLLNGICVWCFQPTLQTLWNIDFLLSFSDW